MSEFMANFTTACDLELDGYKGKYRGFMTTNDFEKTITKKRYKINLEFDGYFYDDEISLTFDGVTSGSFYMVGSRKAPCTVEVYAKSTLTNYTISGLGDDDIIVESLAAGKTAIIDGTKGLVTISGENAFDKVNLWEFPAITTGETTLSFSSSKAKVTIRYKPMWI
jgi:phage-related protein